MNKSARQRALEEEMPHRAGNDIASTAFEGEEGFSRLEGVGRFAVPDPIAYAGSWRSMTTEGVELSEFCTSPIVGSAYLTRSRPSVVLIVVAAGALRYSSGTDSTDADEGSMHAVSTKRPCRFAVPTRARLLRVVIPDAVLPHDLPAVGLEGRLPPSRLTGTLTALVEEVLDPVRGGTGSPACHAIRAVAVAVLEELVPRTLTPDLRSRILALIDRNLSDPELGPQSIADALGISLRWAHRQFDDDGSSIAQLIRNRRLELVAAQVRSDRRFPRIGSLAERAGFASRDTLTRAFKARYGTTIAEYAAQAADKRELGGTEDQIQDGGSAGPSAE
jgi:AraC-like DNA-binding protein